jgi:hypothetical protein
MVAGAFIALETYAVATAVATPLITISNTHILGSSDHFLEHLAIFSHLFVPRTANKPINPTMATMPIMNNPLLLI